MKLIKSRVRGIMMLIALCGMFFIAAHSNAQSVVRKGNNFSQVSNTTRDTLETEYTFTDSKGVVYPIIINKATGRCYVWRVSSKTQKGYRAYLKAEISQTIAKELGVEYKETKK